MGERASHTATMVPAVVAASSNSCSSSALCGGSSSLCLLCFPLCLSLGLLSHSDLLCGAASADARPLEAVLLRLDSLVHTLVAGQGILGQVLAVAGACQL